MHNYKPTVTLVEDDKIVARTMTVMLTTAGNKVVNSYDSGEKLIEAIQLGEPVGDVVLMDLHLAGELTGVETSAIITAIVDRPVVYLTGGADDSSMGTVIKSSPFGYLQKPVRHDALAITVATAYQHFIDRKSIEKQSVELETLARILEILNSSKNEKELSESVASTIRTTFGYSAVALRLSNNGHFPYCGSNGFESSFLESESDLRSAKICGLDCVCGLVLTGRSAYPQECFTPFGSFRTANINELVETLSGQKEIHGLTLRNLCGKVGYNSLAVIPIYSGKDIIGTLQLNDTRENLFSNDMISFFEQISASIGLAVTRNRTVFELQESKQAFQEAFAKNEQLSSIINRSPIVTFTWLDSEERTVSHVSDSIQRYGYDVTDLLTGDVTYRSLIHVNDRSLVNEKLTEFYNGNQNVLTLQYRLVKKDGGICWVEEQSWKPEADGTISGFISDITEQHENHTTMQENWRFMNAILEELNTAFIVIDPLHNRVVETNKAAQKLMGLQPEDFKGMHGTKLLSAHYFASKMKLSEGRDEVILKRGEEQIAVQKIVRKIPFKGRLCFVLILYDISDRKQMELQLAHAQKMESIGSLAAGVAHEINTPIQYIGDNLNFALQSFVSVKETFTQLPTEDADLAQFVDFCSIVKDADLEFLFDEVPTAMQEALDGVEKVATIVRAMKRFSHPGQAEKALVDFNELVESTVTVARNEWKYVADVETKLSTDLPLVPILANDMGQVVLNLLVNAAHAVGDVVKASGGKGLITVSTVQEEDFLVFRIQDTGCGIPKENYTKIFNPFFTTKEVGKGTGQGLAILHSIVTERHGGKIGFESEVGVGTTFIISLPLQG